MDEERTEHNSWSFLSSINSHVVHPSTSNVLLASVALSALIPVASLCLLTRLLSICPLVLRSLIRAIISIMPRFSTLETTTWPDWCDGVVPGLDACSIARPIRLVVEVALELLVELLGLLSLHLSVLLIAS